MAHSFTKRTWPNRLPTSVLFVTAVSAAVLRRCYDQERQHPQIYPPCPQVHYLHVDHLTTFETNTLAGAGELKSETDRRCASRIKIYKAVKRVRIDYWVNPVNFFWLMRNGRTSISTRSQSSSSNLFSTISRQFLFVRRVPLHPDWAMVLMNIVISGARQAG